MNAITTHFLKHKNINVAELTIEKGNIIDISAIFEKEHLPFLDNRNSIEKLSGATVNSKNDRGTH